MQIEIKIVSSKCLLKDFGVKIPLREIILTLYNAEKQITCAPWENIPLDS
jgi:hypothetical protein